LRAARSAAFEKRMRPAGLGPHALVCLLAAACSNRLDLGHDRQPPLAAGALCGGGPCFAGGVIELARAGSAKGLALDGGTAFWAATSDAKLMRTARDGSGALGLGTPNG